MTYDFVPLSMNSVNFTIVFVLCIFLVMGYLTCYHFWTWLDPSSFSSLLYLPWPQTGAGLWPAGLCVWTDPSGGVHVDLHVPVCADGSLHPVPPVVTDPVWVLSSPQVVQFAVCLSIPALPRYGSGIPAYICGGDQQFSTCFLLHHHPGTGRWPARLILVWSPFFCLT